MRRFAHAKVNLSLHITGRRADGYHLLDSIVAFAGDAFDTLSAASSPTLVLKADTSIAPLADNLVMKAALLLQRHSDTGEGAWLALAKLLPVGGGIGGGSADAAAALHLLNQFWRLGLSTEQLAALGGELGADVPVCVHGTASRMQGVGEKISPVMLPELHAVLVNPGVSVETKAVFAQGIPAGAPIPPQKGMRFPDWLNSQRNDLEPYALKLAPVIGDVLAALRGRERCLLARMSGSGSTCFGLFATRAQADSAASALRKEHPRWWVIASSLV